MYSNTGKSNRRKGRPTLASVNLASDDPFMCQVFEVKGPLSDTTDEIITLVDDSTAKVDNIISGQCYVH